VNEPAAHDLSSQAPRCSRPIFVVGYMHSGTTLLHNILSANSAVFAAADETRYFAYLPHLTTLYPDLADDGVLSDLIVMLVDQIEHGDPARLRTAPKRFRPAGISLTDADLATILEAAKPDRTYGAVFRIVFDFLTQRAGKTRWLEKTPQHVFLIDEILHSVPNALFVEIVRDPRDILASKKKRKQIIRAASHVQSEQKRIQTLERVYDPFWEALEWRMALRAGQRARLKHPDEVYSIRYEDLVAQPDLTIGGVCDFLDLEFRPNMLDVRWWNTAEGDRSAQTGIVSNAIGRWQATLSPAEVGLCQWIGGAPFVRAGYRRAPVSLAGRLLIPWLVVRAGLGLTDRLVRRWRLGGFSFLMNTLKNYWKELGKLAQRR
jgi:hypothetical protein